MNRLAVGDLAPDFILPDYVHYATSLIAEPENKEPLAVLTGFTAGE